METEQLYAGGTTELMDPLRQEWREKAILDSLAADATNGNGEDVLLGTVRRHSPGKVTMVASLDRVRLMRFLRQKCEGGFQNLIQGDDSYRSDSGAIWPFVGWYSLHW